MKRQPNCDSARTCETEVTGQLSLTTALAKWERELILPALAKLLTPATPASELRKSDDARPI
jgi:hypothetical protein